MCGLRDMALIAAMFCSFARVSAVLKLKVDDYYHNGVCRALKHEHSTAFNRVHFGTDTFIMSRACRVAFASVEVRRFTPRHSEN